jgi:hypothetical protein
MGCAWREKEGDASDVITQVIARLRHMKQQAATLCFPPLSKHQVVG